MSSIAASSTAIHYPESDGRPMVETDAHYREMTRLKFALEVFFEKNPAVYVGANLMMYYLEGDPTKCVSPDVFVAFGIAKGERRTFKIWEEGKGPDVVFELTSDSTRAEDLGFKRWLYGELGVREFFVFDPLRQYLQPVLRGFRLTGNEFMSITAEPAASGELRMRSAVLGLDLVVRGNELWLLDARTGRWLLGPHETEEARRQAEEAREAAEREVERLRAELQRLRPE
ncbi:MAG: Uma2 family endonuclease [Acidobacteriota bacterium]